MAVVLVRPYAKNMHLAPVGNHASNLSLKFYRSDALSVAQPIMSKH